MTPAPQSLEAYLDALKRALEGSPPGLIADALADAEEHFRGALATHPGISESDVFAEMARSYGSPEEVAEEYRASETAPAGPFAKPSSLHEAAAPAPVPVSAYGGFLGVASDPVTYGALLYMLLSLITGVFYFTWAVTGISMSFGFVFLIIGIPFFLLFVGSVRLLSHFEGRIVEGLLGVRMPRRLPASSQHLGFWERVKDALMDLRTWSSIAYMLLMLPLGVIYFVVAVVGLFLSLGLTAGGFLHLFGAGQHHISMSVDGPPWLSTALHSHLVGFFCVIAGVLCFFLLLHAARLIGRLHGRIAEHLLVRL